MITRHTFTNCFQEVMCLPQRFVTADGDERGASLVEYALLVALIALVCVAAVTLLGSTLAPRYSSVADSLS